MFYQASFYNSSLRCFHVPDPQLLLILNGEPSQIFVDFSFAVWIYFADCFRFIQQLSLLEDLHFGLASELNLGFSFFSHLPQALRIFKINFGNFWRPGEFWKNSSTSNIFCRFRRRQLLLLRLHRIVSPSSDVLLR